jgi:hypothetical protein
VQIGSLDPIDLPVASVAEARKLVDKTLPNNALMSNGEERRKADLISNFPYPHSASPSS